MEIKGITIYAAEGKKIAPVGSKYAEDYGSAFTLLKGQSEKDFIEVSIDELPPERPINEGPSYEERVNSRVREIYTESQEFAILRQRDTKPEEFKEYFDIIEKIKEEEKCQ